MLHAVEEKEFRSVSADEAEPETEDEKKELEQKQKDNGDLLSFLSETLSGKVGEVRISARLKTHPVCLASKGGISIEMEKVLNAMPVDQKVKAERVLELNADHPVFGALKAAYESDKDKAARFAVLLYNQALLIEGLPLENPVEFSEMICGLMQ